MSYVDELRTKLESGIHGRALQPGDFAQIAHEALASFGSGLPDPFELLNAMACDRDRGQHPAEHPAASILSLFRSRELEIHLGSWLDGYVTPHHHDWEGAFQVIDGEAVQCHYDFEESKRLDEHFGVGTLRRRQIRTIKTGDITIVWPDERTIHSVQHFRRGSFSIAIRHLHPGTPFPGYWRPGVRVDLGYPDEIDTRRAKALDVLHHTRRRDYLRAQQELVRTGDYLDAWYAMRHASDCNDGPAFAMVGDVARERHGESIEPIIGAIQDKRRSQLYTKFREALRTEQDRRVLAALYYGESRADTLAILELVSPGTDPLQTLHAWFRSLVERRAELGGTPLGLAVDDTSAALFRGLVDGQSVDEILQGLRHEYGADQVEARRGVLETNCRILRAHPAFTGLFERPLAQAGQRRAAADKVPALGTSVLRTPTTSVHLEGSR